MLAKRGPNIAGLQLKDAVEQPDQPQHDLQPAPGPLGLQVGRRGPARCADPAGPGTEGRWPAAPRLAGAAADEGRKRVANASSDPPALTHRPGPPRASTMESPPSVRSVAANWMSRYPEKPSAANPPIPTSHRDRLPPRTACHSPATAMRMPAATRMRPLLPRTPGMPMSPAKVSTQGRNAPATMTAPAAAPVSPAARRQLRSGACCGRVAGRVVMLIMVSPLGCRRRTLRAAGAGSGRALSRAARTGLPPGQR